MGKTPSSVPPVRLLSQQQACERRNELDRIHDIQWKHTDVVYCTELHNMNDNLSSILLQMIATAIYQTIMNFGCVLLFWKLLEFHAHLPFSSMPQWIELRTGLLEPVDDDFCASTIFKGEFSDMGLLHPTESSTFWVFQSCCLHRKWWNNTHLIQSARAPDIFFVIKEKPPNPPVNLVCGEDEGFHHPVIRVWNPFFRTCGVCKMWFHWTQFFVALLWLLDCLDCGSSTNCD